MNGDSDVSNFKCSAFHILLKKIGFKFGKHKNKALSIERGKTIVWHHDYLRKMKRLRSQEKNVIYLD